MHPYYMALAITVLSLASLVQSYTSIHFMHYDRMRRKKLEYLMDEYENAIEQARAVISSSKKQGGE